MRKKLSYIRFIITLVFGIILYLGFLAFNISRNVEDNNEKNKQISAGFVLERT